MDVTNVSFRRLTLEDLPLLYEWIKNEPIVNDFWGYDHEGPYEEFIKGFMDSIEGREPTEPYMIFYHEVPIGYVQTYMWKHYPVYGEHIDLKDAAGLDILIGNAEFRGKGLGADILRRFLSEAVFTNPDVERCIIDPEVRNSAAVRAYEKVGFQIVKRVEHMPGEPGPGYLMELRREQLV